MRIGLQTPTELQFQRARARQHRVRRRCCQLARRLIEIEHDVDDRRLARRRVPHQIGRGRRVWIIKRFNLGRVTLCGRQFRLSYISLWHTIDIEYIWRMMDLKTFSFADFEASAGKAAGLLRTLGNEKRLMILCQLGDSELPAGALQEPLGLSQSALSQHLAVLREAGVLATRRGESHRDARRYLLSRKACQKKEDVE